jgi:hypothetical protein
MVAHACNSSIWEAEAEELGIQEQSQLYSKILFQKEKQK